MGCACRQVVSVRAFHSDDLFSNPAKACQLFYFVKMLWKEAANGLFYNSGFTIEELETLTTAPHPRHSSSDIFEGLRYLHTTWRPQLYIA